MTLLALNFYYITGILFVLTVIVPLGFVGAIEIVKQHKNDKKYIKNWLFDIFVVPVWAITFNHIFYATKPLLDLLSKKSPVYWIGGTIQLIYFILIPFVPLIIANIIMKRRKLTDNKNAYRFSTAYICFFLIQIALFANVIISSYPNSLGYMSNPARIPNLISIAQLFDPILIIIP